MKLEGIITALVTPFDENGNVNEKALREMCRFQLNKRVNGLFLLGTTGEGILQGLDERKRVLEIAVDELKGKLPILVHVGSSNVKEVFELAKHAVESGANAITSITPYFFKNSDKEIVDYYVELSKSVPVDYSVYVYNFPEASGNDIKPEILEELLSKASNIAGLKYSSDNMMQMQEYTKLKKDGFSVLTGCDQLFYPMLCMGCDGLVSGNANILPELYQAIFNNFKNGNHDEAKKYHYLGSEIAKLFKYGNVPAIKAGMKFIGLDGGDVRKPFIGLDDNEVSKLHEDFTKIFNQIKEEL